MTADGASLSARVQLRSITLLRLEATSSWATSPPPSVPPSLALKHGAEGRDLGEVDGERLIEVRARMTIRTEEPEPTLFIEANYRLLYAYGSEPPGEDELAEFADRNGLFNVWPYWRELTSSLFGRMELPLPPLPVYHARSD